MHIANAFKFGVDITRDLSNLSLLTTLLHNEYIYHHKCKIINDYHHCSFRNSSEKDPTHPTQPRFLRCPSFQFQRQLRRGELIEQERSMILGRQANAQCFGSDIGSKCIWKWPLPAQGALPMQGDRNYNWLHFEKTNKWPCLPLLLKQYWEGYLILILPLPLHEYQQPERAGLSLQERHHNAV